MRRNPDIPRTQRSLFDIENILAASYHTIQTHQTGETRSTYRQGYKLTFRLLVRHGWHALDGVAGFPLMIVWTIEDQHWGLDSR
jgi:hypothetical protein